MWKLFTGITLTISSFTLATEPPPEAHAKPPAEPSVSAECCGRMRHGMVAIGCETTGTTITFNGIVWELQLHDDAARNFAKRHHGEPVVVTGELRNIVGTEAKQRWIIDVETMTKMDPTKVKEGSKLTIRGTLRGTHPSKSDAKEILVEVDDKTWKIDTSTDAKLLVNTKSLMGESIVAKCHVARANEKDSSSPIIIRMNSVQQAGSE